MVLAMTLLIVTGGLLLWLWLAWTHRTKALDPALRLYRKLQRRLEKQLGPALHHEGPVDFRERVRARSPSHARVVNEFIDEYIALRYAEERDASMKKLRRLLSTIKA